MRSYIIYEKTFPKDPLLEELEQKYSADQFNEQQAQYPSFMDMMADIERNTTYIPRPYRILRQRKFIRSAIALSEFYKIDLSIAQRKGSIAATFFFDIGGAMHNLNSVTGMSDEFEFLTNIHGHDICMTLNYYTHRIIRGGRVISPK